MPAKKEKADLQQKISDADILLELGMRVGIVRLQTKLPESMISKRAKLLRKRRGDPKGQGHRGRWKSTKSVISTHGPHMEAVSFLLLYLRYSEGPSIRIDSRSFVKAFIHYCSALEIDPTSSKKEPIEINKCWVLARDYREGMIALNDCKKCEGGKLIRYQSELNSRCPACGRDGQPEEYRKKDKAERRKANASQNQARQIGSGAKTAAQGGVQMETTED